MENGDPATGVVSSREGRAVEPVPEDVARSALTRILSSASFAQAGRLSRFLRFAAREVLAGRGDRLKEYVVAVEVFDRPSSFNPATDSVVRVEARRLRAKLASFYANEGRDEQVIIELPKGSYAPVFTFRASPAPSVPGTAGPRVGVADAAIQRREDTAVAELGASPDRSPTATRHSAVLVGMAVALVGISVAVWAMLWTSRPSTAVVAVLPFDSVGGGADEEYFSFGVMEDLTARLSGVEGIRVVARTSASHYKRGDDVATIAQRLGATAVVEGSVRRSGPTLRVTAQLIDAASGQHLWAHTYDRTADDVFAAQDDVTRDATSAIVSRLTGQLPAPTSHPEVPAAALAAYWKGRFDRARRTADGRRQSVAHFEEAVALAPQFAAAHAAVGEVYATLAFHGEAEVDSSIAKAKTSIRHALELDDDLADAHNTLAWIRFFYDWDWPAADRGFQRAITLNPSHAGARQLYALGLASRGRFGEAIAQSDTAVELDPMAYVVSAERAAVLYCSRRYDDAIRHALRALEANPDAAVRGVLGSSYAARGQYVEALAEFEKSMAAFGRMSYVLARMGHAYVGLGRVQEARALLAELESGQEKGDVAPVHLAYLYAALGEKDKALDALSRACDRHDGDVVFIGVEPLLDPLRDDPRFAALLRRVHLAD